MTINVSWNLTGVANGIYLAFSHSQFDAGIAGLDFWCGMLGGSASFGHANLNTPRENISTWGGAATAFTGLASAAVSGLCHYHLTNVLVVMLSPVGGVVAPTVAAPLVATVAIVNIGKFIPSENSIVQSIAQGASRLATRFSNILRPRPNPPRHINAEEAAPLARRQQLPEQRF